MRDKLTYQETQMLLDRLSTDDGYRDLFSADPAAALREIGVTEFSKLTCIRVEALADKATIAQARLELTALMTQKMQQAVHRIDASYGKRARVA